MDLYEQTAALAPDTLARVVGGVLDCETAFENKNAAITAAEARWNQPAPTLFGAHLGDIGKAIKSWSDSDVNQAADQAIADWHKACAPRKLPRR